MKNGKSKLGEMQEITNKFAEDLSVFRDKMRGRNCQRCAAPGAKHIIDSLSRKTYWWCMECLEKENKGSYEET